MSCNLRVVHVPRHARQAEQAVRLDKKKKMQQAGQDCKVVDGCEFEYVSQQMVRQAVQRCDAVELQSRKHLKVHPVAGSRPARSASAPPLRNNHNIHGALLVCRAVPPMLTDSIRQQAVQHYSLGMRAVQHHAKPDQSVQHCPGHTGAIAAT